MSWVVFLGLGVLAVGLSAVTLAERKREPCTACGKGELKVKRDFAYHCTACKAVFERCDGALVRREA